MSSTDAPRLPSTALLKMAQAHREAAILITACQLEVFTHLAHEPRSAEALAHACGVPPRGLWRLLNACVVLDLLEKDGEFYRNTPIAADFLVRDMPGYMGHFIARGAENYAAWGRLSQAIREDRPGRPTLCRDASHAPTGASVDASAYVPRLSRGRCASGRGHLCLGAGDGLCGSVREALPTPQIQVSHHWA